MSDKEGPGALRDRIRANILGFEPEFQSVTLQVRGDDVEVREPTEVQKQRIIRMAGGTKVTGKGDEQQVELDMSLARVACVIELTYVPGSKTKLFSEADKQYLLEQPSSRGWFKELADAAMGLFGAGEDDAGKSETEETPA